MSFPQLIPSNPSSPVRHLTLDINFGFAHQRSKSSLSVAPVVMAAAASLANAHVNAALCDSDSDDDDEHDVREVDLSADSPVYSDAGSSSSSSSAYSPVTKTTFEADNVSQLEPKKRNKSLSDDLPDWLQDRSSPFSPSIAPKEPVMDFSHAAQQLKQDIHQALDSAVTRVTRENERRELFQQELSRAASYPVSVDETGGHEPRGGNGEMYGFQPPPTPAITGHQVTAPAPVPVPVPVPAPAELLLLMEVVIGEGHSETIEVHVGDEPQELARQFAAKHALKPDAIPKLAQLIQDQLDALNLEELGFFDDAPSDTGATVTSDETHNPMPEQQHHHQVQECQEYRPELSLQPPPAPSTLSPHQQQRDESQFASSYWHEPPPRYPPSANDNDTGGGGIGYHDPEPDATGYEKQEREHSRAMNYQNLMAKYGHYSQHSGKVNPHSVSTAATASHEHRVSDGGSRPAATAASSSKANDSLTFRNIQLAEHTHRVAMPAETGRRHTLSGHSKHHHSSSKHSNSSSNKPPAVFDRLYALAESKDKWIRRAQNAKQRELEREQDQRKVAMAAKSRDLIAHRVTGGYAHIGERLYEEALSDMAKKDRVRKQRAAEREHQIDWMCHKCAFVNQHSDDVCRNIVATMSAPGAGTAFNMNDDSRARARRDSVGACFMDTPEVICGQQKPEQLFHPTLLASSSSVANAISMNKERAVRVASIRRQKNQQAIEDEFRQTCPFKPKINEVSEEIVRERLESEATRASSTATTTTTTVNGELRRKDPHLALYEDSFHVRANKQAREEEYLRQYSFKPDIGVNALWINGDKTKEDFVERLAVSKYQELEKKRQALHDKYAFDRDPNSGREYFKPETGRAPVFNRNERGLPIGEFLHESHREQQEYHRRLLQQSMQELHQKRHQGFVSETSRQALAMRKKKTFSRIFDALVKVSTLKSDGPCPQAPDTDPTVQDTTGSSDQSLSALATVTKPDDHGAEAVVVISSLVQLELLPREIAQVAPIIFEFANHEPFTREQFGSYMDKLMTEVPGFTYTQVLFLAENLNDGKSSRASLTEKHASNNGDEAEAEELTFHPVIDKNSSVIAKKHGRADRSKVFQALNQYFEHYKDRKTQIKKQQQREFERTHPFQPTLATKNRKQTSANFYDKIKRMEQQHQVAVASTGVSLPGGHPVGQAGDTPSLHTAIANARPCVRPIENDMREMMVALETRSSSCASSLNYLEDSGQQTGSDEEADLTSRVLAALDELPSSAPPPSSSTASSSSLSQSQSSSSLAMLSNADASRNAKLLLAQEDSDRVLLRSPESARTTVAAPSYSF